MADEKNIRVSVTGDASGLNKEIKRSQEEMRKSFTELGLEDVLEKANSQFDKTIDRIRAIKEALSELDRKQSTHFDEEGSKGNPAYRNNIERKRKEYEERHSKAKKALEDYEKRYGSEEAGSFNRDTPRGQEKTIERRIGAKMTKTDADYMTVKLLGVNVKDRALAVYIVGRNGSKGGGTGEDSAPGNKPIDRQGKANLLSRIFSRTFGSGEMNLQGGATEAAVGEGGASSAISGAAGASAGLIAGAALTASIALISKMISQGMEQMRAESKAMGSFSLRSSGFEGDYNNSATGMDKTELLRYGTSIGRARGSAVGLAEGTRRRAYLQKSYGLEDSDIGGLDRFHRQGAGDASSIIADVLIRSEKQGILGVSRDDFTRLPEKLQNISSILAMQKQSGETVDSGFATSMTLAGSRIGGRFGDDRLGEVMGRMNSSIQSPGNSGMRAYIFEMLKRANPNASYTDVLGKMENGASGENLRAVLPQIANMQQGEMRRMVLFQLTKNWQDAIRLDKQGNLGEMIKATQGMEGSSQDAIDKKYGEVKKRAEDFQLNWDKLKNTITDGVKDAGSWIATQAGLGNASQNNSIDFYSALLLGNLSGAFLSSNNPLFNTAHKPASQHGH